MNTSTTLNARYDNFDLNKSKLKWKGTLEDLKAFVLAEIDANTAENVNWKSPSGGKWTFDSEALSDALGSANPIETALDNSIGNLLADEDDTKKHNFSKESVHMTALTTA